MKKTVWKADWMIGLLVMLVFLLLTETSLLRALDGYAYDLGMRYSSDKTANDDLVIVAIDDKSLRALGAWPWSRDLIAEATRVIAKSKPRVIAFNIPFDLAQGADKLESVENLREVLKAQKALKRRVRKALEATETSLDTDQKLASILRTAGRIVLAMPYVEGHADATTAVLPDYLHKFALRDWSVSGLPQAMSLYPPIEVLTKQVGGVGVTNARIGPQLSSHQSQLIIRYGDYYLPSFELMLSARHLGLSAQHIKSGDGQAVILGDRVLATDRHYSVYPRFYPAKDNQPAFKVFSIVDIINGEIASSELRRKTVLIGVTSSQHVTSRMTAHGEPMSPTMVAAHTVSSLINEETYRVPTWADWGQKIVILLIGLYLMFVLTRLRKTSGLFTSGFLLLIMVNAHFILMSSQSTWAPLMAAILALVVGHLMIGARQTVTSQASGVHRALSEANQQLGLSFQGQGQLDQAFEKFKQCEIDSLILGQLYNLGLDYERKRQFNKAIAVFKFIQTKKSGYNDVADRINQNRQAAEAVVLGGGSANNSHAALILDNGDMQKPMLGRYQIEKEIGRGAMGMVYLGRDEKIGRTVAIKTMAMSEEIEPENRDAVKERFFREAEAAGRLNHPNIVTVYDVGEEQDLAYIAMDYLKGKDLTAFCKKKSRLLPLAEVFEIIMSVAKALEYAHEQHVVHRDIKPANIIYHAEKRTAKLTDFGVACLTDASKTKTGTVLGSPYYMSPEQLAGSKVDGRSDLYSLGVTLYQLLAGELPFTSDSMANLMYKIANEKQSDIRSYRPDVPTCVSNIINRALHKEADKRFQSGEQMAASMKRCYNRLNDDN